MESQFHSSSYARRAKRYSHIRLALFAGQAAVSTAAMTWFAFSGRSARLRDAIERCVPDRRLTVPTYLAATTLANWAVHLPLAGIRDLLVDRRFGLTRQAPRGWITDHGKGLAVNLAIGVPLGTAAQWTIRARPRDWWLVLATATFPLSVVFARLAPVLLMPVFNRFEPLRDDMLEARLRALAERAGVAIAAVYRMDMSRQTEKPNAFFTGLGSTRRIVLADTLLDRFDGDEIEGIVAHELGHQVHGDIWRFIAVGSVAGYGLAFLTHLASRRIIAATSAQTRVSEAGDVAALPILALIASASGFILTPMMAGFSRAIETRTDRYALRLTGNGPAYARALTKLGVGHLADPNPPRWIVLLLYSHPPLTRRIAMAESYASVSHASGSNKCAADSGATIG
jgi:STE24 endopeptidase